MNIRYPIYEGVYRILTLFLPEPLLGFTDAVHGCRENFIRWLFLPNYSYPCKEEFCKKCTSSHRIKCDGLPLHLVKPNR